MKHRQPNLFLIGAPKCGTTTIASWLAAHPQVHFSEIKEPHHFYSPHRPKMDEWRYNNLFCNAPPGATYLAEGSVWYLFGSEIAIPQIERNINSAKYIVCLRNPITMAPSLHAQKLATGHEVLRNFSEAWKASDTRSRGEPYKIFGIPDGDPRHMAYKESCRIGTQLQTLYKLVSQHRIHIIFLDDIISTPTAVWSDLLRFLNLPFQEINLHRNHNPATKRKSQTLHQAFMSLALLKSKLGIKKPSGLLKRMVQANLEAAPYPEVPDSIRREIIYNFIPEIEILEDITGRDLSHWKK